MKKQRLLNYAVAGLVALGVASPVLASSHREAPFTAKHPSVDATDFYMFMAYGAEPAGNVVFLANYNPLQAPFGGPNYFALNPNALYEINVDNNGDAKADITFQFRFQNNFRNLTVPTGNSKNLPVPLINIGGISAGSDNKSTLNRVETYTVDMVTGGPRSGNGAAVKAMADGSTTFTKPVDYIGQKSLGPLSDYMAYAQQYMYAVTIPGCNAQGKVFVGQRKEGFAINLGEVFDLVNLNPVGAMDYSQNVLSGKNITTIALEVPASCLTADADHPVIGAWTTASVRQAKVFNPKPSAENDVTINGGAWTQVSRLGMPLVNEVVIGLPDKNAFNASQPSGDAQFLDYVTNPTLPVLLNVLFKDAAKVPGTPRNDLVTVFLTGVPGLNQPADVTPSEMLRLNTGVAGKPAADQSNLGVLGGDTAGFPNGRRPGDDVTDIALRVVEGALCGTAGSCGDMTSPPNTTSSGDPLPYTDGATHHATDFLTRFPYLNPPIPGSPNSAREAASTDTNAGGD
ncbi:MAG TPA: DUF4331 domain-containing protein [Gammaproteobacteria bacterium]|nr:DUF4331 domain-containing protein [Gammaproteobacteria bacterium]